MPDIYPDVDEDATGADGLVRFLSEWNEDDHFMKAVALVGAARREWQASQQAGEKDHYHDDFEAFATMAVEEWDDKLEDREE